jgi:putative membrane protein
MTPTPDHDRNMNRPDESAPTARPLERWFPRDPTKVGDDPDYRFTLANERTFLAWVRTALALSAGGLLALTVLDDVRGEEFLGIGLLVISFLTAATAYRRWALNERAMRLNAPLPPSRLPLLMAIGVAIVALVAALIAALN